MPSLGNAILWITLSPISEQIGFLYNQNQLIVNMSSLVFMLLYIFVNFPSNYVLGLNCKNGVLLGAAFTIIGSWIRVLVNKSFWYVILGQILGAIGQPFILNAPAKIATEWFIPKQRPAAIAALALINMVGIGIGFLIPSIFVENTKDMQIGKNQVYNLMFWEAIIISAGCAPIFILFKNKPKTPPSHSANTEKMSFKQSIPVVFANKDYIILLIAFGCVLGNFSAISTLMNYYLIPYNLNNQQISFCGATFIVSGLIGSTIFSIIIEKTGKYKKILIFSSFFAMLSQGLQIGMILTYNIWYILLGIFFFGFFAIPLIPLSMDFACELTFPVCEAFSSGLIYACGQFVGLVLILISDLVFDLKNKTQVIYSNCIGMGFMVLSVLFYCIIGENLLRKTEENKNQLKYINNSNSELLIS
ncbi:major facilitator superfamily protein, putative [Ichthyophthirius multifiliis]|uniref:Major facilitator superfamily protein, putative n=1 Tax=Ichthyophthirius multifiliis TaxID=5932 RepID=G0QJN5_ICHMU|nr:major facilitator superfamily protein, putative [Ichthyophthirius multifiliis]EGR34572.1 major facilitator superfamily protein, putative [Ichthyophthirius multifiliis]|eukprot:XP_004039876.1 major facilitator superfamily protein, putative [Ichthyophthirius multifiliis]